MKVKQKKQRFPIHYAAPVISIFIAQFFDILSMGFVVSMRTFLSSAFVFYWSLFKPQLIFIPVIFIISIFKDTLTQSPFGYEALFCLLTYYFALTQRRFLLAKGFSFLWASFSFFLLFLNILEATFSYILISKSPNLSSLFVGTLLTALLYPLISYFASKAQKIT